MTNPVLADIIKALELAKAQRTYRKLDFFEPYPKQQAFMDAGAHYRERLLIAGNQLGKSYVGAAETAMHLTGEYPKDGWFGRRWERPITGWAAGESSLVVRDVQQRLLCGQAGVDSLFGTGMIPREAFADKPTLARGVTNAFDSVQVKHLAPDGASVDGISMLRFKSYEQGRQKLQADSIDWWWCDEEPEEDIYSEIVTRTTATGGCGILTFTPLLGMSKVVSRFLTEHSPDRFFVTMTIDDALHIPPERRAAIVAAYPEHQREARARGVPMMGEGLVYAVPHGLIAEPTIQYVPDHWTKLWAVDFGIAADHPFAAVLEFWDKDADCIHVAHCFKMSNSLPLQQADIIKRIAGNVPIAWPHDGAKRDPGSGISIAKRYKDQGLLMLPEHTTWPDGGYSVEAGILEIRERMDTSRFHVAAHLEPWFEEQRLYHRDGGLIVKRTDDIMDATRIGVMGKRHGKPGPIMSGAYTRRRQSQVAADVDFDVHA